jgi:hypothetical protein
MREKDDENKTFRSQLLHDSESNLHRKERKKIRVKDGSFQEANEWLQKLR